MSPPGDEQHLRSERAVLLNIEALTDSKWHVKTELLSHGKHACRQQKSRWLMSVREIIAVYPFKDEAQTALFKDPVCTAQ